jgi:MFS family permease
LGLLPGDAAPYRLALWIAVAIFFASWVPFYLLHEDRQRAAPIEPGLADVSMVNGDVYKRIASFAAANALVGIGGGLIIPFFNVYFTTQFSLPAERVGAIFAVSQALMGIGMLLSPALARRTGKVAAIVGGHLSVVPFLCLLAVTNNAWFAAAGYWGRNAGINATNPIYGAFAMEMVPARLRATLSGINNMAWNATWAVSSAVGGLLILSLGYQKVFLISAFFYVAPAAVYVLAFRRYWRKV